MTLTIIGLCGLAGSGKSTVAMELMGRHGFWIAPFARVLKAMSGVVLTSREMSGDLKETPLAKLGGRTPRQFMQLLGTEFGRANFGEDFWVDIWRQKIKDESNSHGQTLFVVDDVRFANESQAIRDMGGTVIKLVRDGAGSATGAGHASEALDFRVDLTLHNNGSAEQLADDIAWIVREPYMREAA